MSNSILFKCLFKRLETSLNEGPLLPWIRSTLGEDLTAFGLLGSV
jgi:hypothetical protein